MITVADTIAAIMIIPLLTSSEFFSVVVGLLDTSFSALPAWFTGDTMMSACIVAPLAGFESVVVLAVVEVVLISQTQAEA